ncbi:MAG: hypothetical protein NUW01_00485 [Gemmatimonadaceae bacterium]|nr:hypothetical protein [Gemmatimonadaceae bacterium]
MKRRKRLPWCRRAWAWLGKEFATDDPVRRHRGEGARKGWETRRRNAEDDRVSENLARMEAARVFGSDPTP